MTLSARTQAVRVLSAVVVAVVLSACGGSGQTAGQAVRVSRFVAGAGTAAEYEKIWLKVPRAGQLKRDQQVLQNLDPSIVRLRPSTTATAADTFRADFASSDADVVTLIGHNNGGIFRLPDGSPLDLFSLGTGGPKIAVISCKSALYANGGSVGLPSELSFTLAAEIEKLFVERLGRLAADPDVATLKALLSQTANDVRAQHKERFLTLTIAGGGVGSATVVTVLVWEVR